MILTIGQSDVADDEDADDDLRTPSLIIRLMVKMRNGGG